MPEAPRRNLLKILISVLSEPMFLLLVVAALIYLAIGDPRESLLLGAFAALSIGLVVVQEARSERALDALKALGAPSARVIRDGETLKIAAREVVPGDLLLASEGERVAADGWIERCEDLRIDESLLTGESLAVAKRARLTTDTDAIPDPGGEQLPFAYAGTLVVAGHARLRVARTGIATATGRIGASLATIQSEPTLLQRSIGRLVRWFGAIALVVSVMVLLGYGLLRGDWVQGALSGIALAMAMLPEEFPMALAVFLALGAWRMARVKVLARRPAMVETLGAASVLCVDKTGTLTLNQMRVRVLGAAGQSALTLDDQPVALPEAQHRLLEYALLASKRQAHDPMDLAIGLLAQAALGDSEHLHADYELLHEYGLSAQTPAVSRAWKDASGAVIVACKGAPETVLDFCRLSPADRATTLAQVQQLAAQGLRVLGVASARPAAGKLPESANAFAWTFEGLVALADPLRPTARAAITQARGAGLAVVMITGDYPATALSIAAEAGIDTQGGALSGTELDALDDAALKVATRSVRVYARVRPEQKLRLVQAFKADGQVVAMTGDGVNDAPALKAAHIGLAMGGRGTDVARESAGIVLLDDDIGRINDAIYLGRRIFENLRKVLIYIAAIHLPVAGLALLPLLLGLPPMMLPLHVVLIEMVVDPICSIAFENEPGAPDLLKRGPRDQGEPLVGWRQLSLSAVLGSLLLLVCFAIYLSQLHQPGGADAARTLGFVALTAGNLMLVRVVATPGATLPTLFAAGHRAFWIITAVVSAVIAACILIPALAQIFHFSNPGSLAVFVAIGAGAGITLLGDAFKRIPAIRNTLNVMPAARHPAG